MITTIETTKITTNLTNKKKFSIAESPKAYEILSKLLYKNPVRAVIRELSCNAIDANVDGNSTTPFKIHLPSEVYPEFYVEDSGIGMTEEEVNTIYKTYFASSKNGSNTTIGGLGLGSKSPFSLVSLFNIRTTKQGITSNYVAFKDEEGIPSCSKVNEYEAKEGECGTRISFSIENKLIDSFANEAFIVICSLKELPTIVNGKEKMISRQFNSSTKKFETFHKEIYSVLTQEHITPEHSNLISKWYGSSGETFVNMGGVVYPVDFSFLFDTENFLRRNTFDKEFLKSFINQWKGKNSIIMLQADIGSLNIQPSREELSYDSKTIELILDKVFVLIRDYVNTNLTTSSRKLSTEAFLRFLKHTNIYRQYEKLGANSGYFSKLLTEEFSKEVCRIQEIDSFNSKDFIQDKDFLYLKTGFEKEVFRRSYGTRKHIMYSVGSFKDALYPSEVQIVPIILDSKKFLKLLRNTNGYNDYANSEFTLTYKEFKEKFKTLMTEDMCKKYNISYPEISETTLILLNEDWETRTSLRDYFSNVGINTILKFSELENIYKKVKPVSEKKKKDLTPHSKKEELSIMYVSPKLDDKLSKSKISHSHCSVSQLESVLDIGEKVYFIVSSGNKEVYIKPSLRVKTTRIAEVEQVSSSNDYYSKLHFSRIRDLVDSEGEVYSLIVKIPFYFYKGEKLFNNTNFVDYYDNVVDMYSKKLEDATIMYKSSINHLHLENIIGTTSDIRLKILKLFEKYTNFQESPFYTRIESFDIENINKSKDVICKVFDSDSQQVLHRIYKIKYHENEKKLSSFDKIISKAKKINSTYVLDGSKELSEHYPMLKYFNASKPGCASHKSIPEKDRFIEDIVHYIATIDNLKLIV